MMTESLYFNFRENRRGAKGLETSKCRDFQTQEKVQGKWLKIII